MKKKLYIKPEIRVFQFDIQTAILSMSSLEFAKDDDYTEENIKDLWSDPDSGGNLGRLKILPTNPVRQGVQNTDFASIMFLT